MESLVADISDLKVEEKYQQFSKRYVAPFKTESAMKEWPQVWKDNYKNHNDEEAEKKIQDEFETTIPETELKDVQLRYIPDFIRELEKKRDYWEKEYLYWHDYISEKNSKKYEKKLHEEIIKLKTVIKNLDKMVHSQRESAHLSQSLDPERVQSLVDYITEKESNDMVLQAMLDVAFFRFDYVQRSYVLYAIYAKYGKFVCRPSRSRCVQIKKEG